MQDVQRINRWLGGTAVVMRQVRRWLKGRGNTKPITFLDIATGSADIPRAIIRYARRQALSLRVIGLDSNPHMLRLACEESVSFPECVLIRGNALALPLADASVDYVLCSLTFHHFDYQCCVFLLREMERIARRGWLVNDLRRSRMAWLLITIITRLACHPLTQHDGPVSVMRAYTVEEYTQMIAEAEIGAPVAIRRHHWYRVSLVRTKGEGDDA